MLTQPDLDFPRTGPPPATPDDLDRVIRFLHTRGPAWTTAHDLLISLGHLATENRKRWLRRLAEESDGQIISGQLGYKLTRHATPDETHHAAAWLEHQALRLGDRARAIRRAAFTTA